MERSGGSQRVDWMPADQRMVRLGWFGVFFFTPLAVFAGLVLMMRGQIAQGAWIIGVGLVLFALFLLWIL